MRPNLTVGAIAIATRRANAVGAVRVTCEEAGLDIELLRVTSFSWGFAPAGLADPVHIQVPYTAVRGVLCENRVLFLALDPALSTPHSRFALARFAEDPTEVLARVYQTRVRAVLANRVLPGPLGILGALLAPPELVSGLLGRVSFGALIAVVVWVVLRQVVVLLSRGGPWEDRLRDRLESELLERVSLAVHGPVSRPSDLLDVPLDEESVAGPTHETGDSPPEVVPPVEGEGNRKFLRPGLAVAAAVAAAIVTMAFLNRYDGQPASPPPVDVLRAGLVAAVRANLPELHTPPPPPRCICARAASPLWEHGIPKAAALLFEGEGAAGQPTSKPGRKDRPRYDFELAVVNDAAVPIRDVRFTLTFARRTPDGARTGAVDRGFFWEGALGPGRAVKWRVSAPGTEFRLDTNMTGTLEEAGLDPAPADAFFKLTSSRFRAVRIHAATLLAYLRDPRAREVALGLGSTGPGDAELIARIRRASAKIIACDLQKADEMLDACLFNASEQVRTGIVISDVPSPNDEPPRHRMALEGSLPIHDGIRVHVPWPGDPPRELSVEVAPLPGQ